jgi:glycosyltransferase involved in cell wall biosynthesis
MRIAVNTRFLSTERMEGIGRFSHEVLRRLVRRRPQDEFVFLFDRPFDPGFLYAPNVTGHVLPPPARHPWLWYLWFEWAVPFAIRRFGADLFFSPDNFSSLGSPVPAVVVIHDLAYLHYPEHIPRHMLPFLRRNTPRYCWQAAQLLAVSEYTRQDLIRQFQIAPERIHLTCNGPREGLQPLTEQEAHRARLRYSEGHPYFLYVGAVHPRKNVHRLIRGFDRFKTRTGSPAKLLLAGRFAWKAGAVRTAWEQTRHHRDVHFLGYVPDEELPVLLGGALALAYVSLFEGFGVPVLDALHAEVPVITSNVSSLPEVAGRAALLVPPESTDAIAHALERLWLQPRLREELKTLGRQQRKQFSWERAADGVDRALQQALSPGS